MINLIRLDYDGVMKRAADLDRIADGSCAELISKTKAAMVNMEAAWQGNSGTEMQGVLSRRLNKLTATQSQLHSLASMMRSSAEKLKTVDDKLAKMFF